MSRLSWLAAAAVVTLAACAGTNGASSTSATSSSAMASNAQPMATNPSMPSTAMPAPQAQAQVTTPAPSTPVQPTTFSDAQLRSFAHAAMEIQPINATLATATPEQRTAAVDQIRAVLTLNNLDGATYNAIAAQAQADPALAARITALNNTSTAPG